MKDSILTQEVAAEDLLYCVQSHMGDLVTLVSHGWLSRGCSNKALQSGQRAGEFRTM